MARVLPSQRQTMLIVCVCTHGLYINKSTGVTSYSTAIAISVRTATLMYIHFLHPAIEAKGNVTFTPVQVINIEIKDNHEEATLGAFLILQICDMVR